MQETPIIHDQLTYARGGATPAADHLVQSHGQLVRRIAWHVHSRMSSAVEVEDLIQIGMIALVEAARVFEDRGIAFAPYAATRIRGAMIDQLRRDARMGRAGMVNRRRLAAVRARLEAEQGRAPSDAEMAAAMGIDGATYYGMLAGTQATQQASIDEVYSDHEMWFADSADAADTQIEQAQLRSMLSQNIARLPEREALILQLYFVEELNLDEIGITLGVGAARVCQIKKAALDRLRVMMGEGV